MNRGPGRRTTWPARAGKNSAAGLSALRSAGRRDGAERVQRWLSRGAARSSTTSSSRKRCAWIPWPSSRRCSRLGGLGWLKTYTNLEDLRKLKSGPGDGLESPTEGATTVGMAGGEIVPPGARRTTARRGDRAATGQGFRAAVLLQPSSGSHPPPRADTTGGGGGAAARPQATQVRHQAETPGERGTVDQDSRPRKSGTKPGPDPDAGETGRSGRDDRAERRREEPPRRASRAGARNGAGRGDAGTRGTRER